MSDSDLSSADPFGAIADEFLEAYRQGKRPSVEEFARRYPEQAAEIRDMLPALALMETAKSVSGAGGEPRRPVVSAPLRQLGDYQILREIGRGGMGVVYEAEQVSLGRHVALKVLPSHRMLDPRQLGRFQREARSAARLHHTNIVPVFGVGEQGGMYYYVMQFIQGQGLDVVLNELRQLRQGTPMPAAASVAQSLLTGAYQAPESALTSAPGEPSLPNCSSPVHRQGRSETSGLSDSGRQYWQSVARIGAQVADALAYAHAQGVLHRDIKPSNLLLDDKGNVWVTDFGLAKAATDSDDLTNTGDIVGTLRYMPPERFNGAGDVRSDVYSLGLTLYEMLTFRPAFEEANRNKLILQVMHDEPTRPRKINPNVPRDLETVVLKAISRDPRHRYQTPAEMADDLKRFIEDRPVRARRVGEVEKFWRWCKRNPLPASLLAALIVVFLGGFAAVSWQLVEVRQERQAKEEQAEQAELARDDARMERDRAAATLYYSQLARVRLEWQSNNVAGARQILGLCETMRRGWEWRYLRGVCHAELFSLEGNRGWICAVAYSPDGKLIASAGTGNPFHGHGTSNVQPGEVILWDAATGQQLRTLHGHKHNLRGAAFSPDGKRLATTSEDGTVRLWDVASGHQLTVLSRAPESVADLAFAPDGTLAVGGSEGAARWRATGERLPTLRLPGGASVRGLTYTPDGRWLVVEGPAGKVFLLDAATGAVAATLDAAGWDGRFGGPAVSPDSKLLAAPSGANAIGIWELPSGKLLRLLTGHEGRVNGLAFSPDGMTLASASEDTTVRLWSVGARRDLFKQTRILRGHEDRATVVAFRPDAQRLVSGGRDGVVRVWDLTRDVETGDVVTSNKLGEPEAIGFGDGGRDLVLACRGGGIVRLRRGTHSIEVQTSVPMTHDWLTPATPGGLDAEGRWLVGVAHDRRTAVCWDATTGRERAVLRGHTVPLWHATLSGDGRRAATAGYRFQPTGLVAEVKVWDAATGQPLFQLDRMGFVPSRVALDVAGGRLALSGFTLAAPPPGRKQPVVESCFVQLFDVETGAEKHRFDGLKDTHHVGLAFDQSGGRLAMAGGQTESLIIRDTATGRVSVRSQQAPAGAMDLAFSPDGGRVAVASRHMVKLLDGSTGEEVLILRGAAQAVPDANGFNPQVRFSPDGQCLLAVCHDYPPNLSEWFAEDESAGIAARLASAERRAVVRLLAPLDREEQLAIRHHYRFVRDAPLTTSWEYCRRADMHRAVGDRAAAVADLERALALPQNDPCGLCMLGELFAELGQWDRAAAVMTKGQDEFPFFPRSGLGLADLLLRRGDLDGYRRQCQTLMRQFATTLRATLAGEIAFRSLLLPGGDPEQARQLAAHAYRLDGARSDYFFIPMALAMAEYRTGRFVSARPWLDQADKCFHPDEDDLKGRGILALLARAMIEKRAGRDADARQAMAQAAERIRKGEAPVAEPIGWKTRAMIQPLLREAEALLGTVGAKD